MLRKIRRQMNKALTGLARHESEKSVLKLEALENRTLLDVAGYWSELGYRSASGGGVSWDTANDVGQTQLVTTTDGDSVVFWIDGAFADDITMDVGSDPVMGTYNFSGTIHARQYAGEDLGWWDLSYGSGDIAIAQGGQIDVAAGPNGSIVLVGVDDAQQAFVMLWNGYDWQNITTANVGSDYATTVNPLMTQVQVNEEAEDAQGTEVDETEIVTEVLLADVSSPSVAVNDAGEIFVSYTVMHPNSNQYEVVVKKYGYTYSDGNVLGAPLPNDRGWVELTSTEVGLIGATNNQQTAGVSNSTGNSFDSAITVDESGRPVVVWTEAYKSNNTEIFVKQWDGDSWEEIGENSASVNPADDNSGISSNSYQDIQPDIAINDDGDIIVSWVCWHNWSNYQTNGQAGIYVKYLPGDDLDGAWRGYNFTADGSNVSSASGAGIAQGNGVPANRAGLGWYYNPQITLDSAGSPAVSWFGWGRNESKAVARNLENPGATDDPFWGTFASYFYDHDSNSATAYTFEMLFEDYNENDYDWKANSNAANSNVQRAVVNEPDMLAWAPSILFTGTGADEKIIISFVQASSSFAPSDHDQEVFVKYWNGTDEAWQSYGLGSDSNGNPLASQYPADVLNSGDVAYFEFNADSTDQYDVVMAVPDEDGTNEGQMYVYNRYSGAWSTKTPTAAAEDFNTIDSDGDGTFGIGRVFDLDGEPEIEYNDITNGTPIVAFLDDTNGMPFVYKYTVSYGWLPVGSYLGIDGQAGGVAGNIDADDNVGIDAQVGPGGKILVAYVATDDNGNLIASDDFDYVVTRIYDPVSDTWSDAYDGRLTTDSVQEVTYFSDFNGFDFDEVGDLTEGEYDDYGRVYDENGKWYYWESDPDNDDDAVEGGLTGYSDDSAAYGLFTDRLHGWYNNDGDLQQGALEFLFTLEDGSTRQEVTAQMDHQFEMISDGDVVIEFDASLDGQGELGDWEVTDPLLNMDLYLYLTVNGRVVDINVNDAQIDNTYFPYSGEVTPVAVCMAGTLMSMTQFKFDTTQMQYANGAAVDLTVGENTIGFIAYAANNGGVPVAAEQKGAIRIDNVVVYQRMISESRFVSGDTDTFDNTSLAAMTAAGKVWTPSGAVTGTLKNGVGQTGSVDDDALNISFASSATQAGVFTRTSSMSEYGYVRLDFDYRMVTNKDFSDDDELQLTVSTTAGGVLGTYTVTGANADSEWVRVSVVAPAVDVTGAVHIIFTAAVTNGDVSVAGTADVYIDNVDISHSLAIDLGGEIDVDNPDTTDGSSWAFLGTGGITADYDNTAGSGGDGAIVITLPDGVNGTSFGAVGYYFETPAGPAVNYSYLSIDFSYNIELAANAVGLGDYGQLAVLLVRDDDGNGVLDSTDTAVYRSDAGLFRQYSDGVTGGNSGWVDVTDFNVGIVNGNNKYFVVFDGFVSDSAAGNDSYIRLDDVALKYTGASEWSSNETNDTDNGGNNTVGWDNNGNWNYNFRGDMHSSLIDNGTIDIHSQLLTIPDYNQAYNGDAIVAFRYRHDGIDFIQANLPDLTDIRVLVDGVEYDKDQIAAQLGGTDLYFDYYDSWSTGNRDDLKYTWFKITIPDLPAGDHDISFELMGGDDFWIDNVVVQSTRSRTDTIDPIVKLGAVGQDGVRPFVVGATYASDELLIYPGSGSDLGDKHLINNHLAGSGVYPFGADAFYHAALFELNDNTWEKYGNSHVALGNLSLVGVPGSDTSVPIAELYSLEDFAIGDNQLIWVALSHATTDPVDTDDADSDINFFAVHPFNMTNPPAYYGPHTDLDIVIRRWDIVDANDTDNQEWLDVPAPITLDTWTTDHELRATFKGQLTSSPDQSIIFAWTNLDPDGARFSSHAYKNINGTWEAFGSDTVNGNIQNNRSWSATLMHEMIVDSSGNPLVLYGMTHLDMYALREFVLERDDSDAVISIPGSNGLFLDFGQISRGVVSRQMTVANIGLGDLIVQNISFGGLEAIEAGFTITNDPGIGTSQSIIPAGANSRYSYNIQFDRSKIDPNLYGTFEGVIVVQTNEGRSENHPFDNFQEVNVRVVIENAGDVIIDSDYYYFDDKIVAGNFDPNDHDDDNNITVNNPYEWQTQTIYVRNDGTDTLNVNSLVHTGAGFAIKSIKKNGSDLAINNMDADDDGLLDAGTSLEAGEYLAVEVAFIPKEAGLYNETIFVCTDDTFEPVIPIRLLGYGLNGGDLEVQTSLDGITWTTVWRTNASDGSDDIDRILDLGSTLWGTSDATPLMVRVNNTGSTTMNVENIRFQSGTAQVAFSPDAVISDIDIAPGSSYTFTLTYTPDTGLVEDINAEDSIRYLMESLFILTDALDDSEVVLSVVGYAVPKAPVLQVIDADTGDIVGGWDPERGFVTDGLMNLGTGNVGSSVFTRTVFLRNLGGAPLTVNGLSVGYVGANASDYVITPANSLNSDLDNTILTMDGLNYTVNITMTPTVDGELKSMFMVDYYWTDIYGSSKYDLSYTGLFAKVTDQAIVLSDNDGIVNNTILDFQKVGIGGTGYGSVIITNQGSSKLNILGWELYNNGVLVVDSDLNDDWVTNANSPFSMLAYESSFKINGNASHTIPLTFDPLAADTVYPAMIRIYSDDATQTDNGDGRYYTDYIISGEGVTPGVLATDVTEVDFGAVEFGQHWSDGNGGFRQTVTITNTSTVNISLVNIYSTSDVFNVWTDMDNDQLFVSGSITNGDYVLAPNESIDVAISFYAAQPFFNTSTGVLPKLVFEYDNYSGSETLQSQEVSLHASVVMADSPSSRSNKLIWSDTNGKLVTISLAGPGSFSVLAVSSDNKDIGAIILSGTTSKSTLKIVGENNNDLPISTIGSIVGANGQAISEIGSIIMQNVNFDGTAYDTAGYDHDIYVQSLTGKLILGDIVDTADIYVASTSTGGAAITTGAIATGTDIYIGGNVKSFTVDSKTNNSGGVQGDSLYVGGDLRSFVVKDYGPVAMDIEVAGDLKTLNAGRSNFYTGDIYVDGSLGNVNLSAATITGSVISDNLNKMTAFALDGATIAVQDTIRQISVRDDMIDSLILAGVTPGADKIIGNTLTNDDVLVGGSTIGKVIIGGTATDSSILAGVGANPSGSYQVFGSTADQQPLTSVSGTIGYVKFGDVKLGAGNTLEYGVAAGTSVNKFILKSKTYRAPEAWNLDGIIGNDFFLKTF